MYHPYLHNYTEDEMSLTIIDRIRTGTVDLQARDSNGCTILHHAAGRGKTRVIQALLAQRVDVNVTDDHGRTPLHLAAASRDVGKTLPLLLKRGANAFAKDNEDRNVLFYLTTAASVDYATNLARVFIEMMGVSPHERDSRGWQPIHWAAGMGNKEFTKLYLDYGASVTAQTEGGQSALNFAMGKSSYITRMMVKALALQKAHLSEPSAESEDEKMIEQDYPKLWNYYQDCQACISRMKSTRFIESCTFFELLAKSRCQIAKLMRNPDFEAKFGLYDPTEFSMYAEDVLGAFERARDHYRSELLHEDVINEAFYHILPDLVVRKVIYYLLCNETRFEKRSVI